MLGFFFLLTLSPFTHTQEYEIQTKAQPMPTKYIATTQLQPADILNFCFNGLFLFQWLMATQCLSLAGSWPPKAPVTLSTL